MKKGAAQRAATDEKKRRNRQERLVVYAAQVYRVLREQKINPPPGVAHPGSAAGMSEVNDEHCHPVGVPRTTRGLLRPRSGLVLRMDIRSPFPT